MVTTADAVSVPTREQVVAIMELLATRMSWSTARPIIASTGIHVSRGWLETIAHAREDSYSDSMLLSAYKILSAAARWHTYVGNKHVSFFDLREQNEEAKNRILAWTVDSAIHDLQPVLRRRPFDILSAPTKQAELESYKTATPKLVAAELQGGKLYLQFFSTRSYSHRESLDITQLLATQAKFFEGYEEVIGVKTRWVATLEGNSRVPKAMRKSSSSIQAESPGAMSAASMLNTCIDARSQPAAPAATKPLIPLQSPQSPGLTHTATVSPRW